VNNVSGHALRINLAKRRCIQQKYSMKKFVWPLVSMALLGVVSTGCAQAWTPDDLKSAEKDFQTLQRKLVQAPPLQPEPIGLAPARAWFSEVDLHQLPSGEWLQLFQLKKDGKSSRAGTYLVALNLNTGKITEAGVLPGLEFGKGVWSNGKFYIGSNMGGESGYLGVYDPQSGALKNLGAAFTQKGYPWKMAPVGDSIAVGAAAGTEISLINTKEDSITRFGPIGEKGHGYVYYIEQDKDYIYAALRGGVPWELVAINKQTHERKVLLTAPPEGFMKLGDGTARVIANLNDKSLEYSHYKLRDGQAVAFDPKTEPTQPSAPSPALPLVVIDPSPTFQYKPEVIIHYQQPREANQWKAVNFPTPLENSRVQLAVALADGRIAGAEYAYAPLVVFDPKTGKGIQAPLGEVSARAIIADGNTVYVGGYPSAVVMKFDPDQPITRPDAAPGEKSVPLESPQANPQRAYIFSSLTEGAHIAVPLLHGHDGRIWLTGRRHRYFKGFDVAWFNPKTGERGVVDDAGKFNQYQVSWMASLDEGRKMVVSTVVQKDSQHAGEVGDSGKLFIIDTQTNAVLADYEPLPGVKTLTGVTQTDPDHLVGAANINDSSQSVYYRFNWKTGETELVKPGARHGVPGTNGLPNKGYDFTTGPDGKVWTAAEIAAEQSVLFKINPQTLEVEPVGKLGGQAMHYLFSGGDVFVTGAAGVDGKIARLPKSLK
jgi:hypothetical protein